LVVIAIGLALFLGAMFADKMLVAGIAGGMMTFGVGELYNHQHRQIWFSGGKIDDRSRRNTLFGVALVAIGMAMTGWFTFRVMAG